MQIVKLTLTWVIYLLIVLMDEIQNDYFIYAHCFVSNCGSFPLPDFLRQKCCGSIFVLMSKVLFDFVCFEDKYIFDIDEILTTFMYLVFKFI